MEYRRKKRITSKKLKEQRKKEKLRKKHRCNCKFCGLKKRKVHTCNCQYCLLNNKNKINENNSDSETNETYPSFDEIVDALEKEYDAPHETLVKDVQQYIADFKEKGLLRNFITFIYICS